MSMEQTEQGQQPSADAQASADRVAAWWSEIDAAEKMRKKHERWWQANIDRYSPKVDRDPDAYGSDVNTNRDFTLVEQKRAQLFFQTPEVNIKPSPLMDGQGAVLLTHQHIVNEMLGPDRNNAIGMVDDALFDLLCPAGFGVTVMGYESVTENVQTDVPLPDPMTGAPAMDPTTGQPLTVPMTVPVPIWERVFWERVSPKRVLIPAHFHSTDYEKSPWLGLRFSMPLAEARQKFTLPEDFEPGKSSDGKPYFDHGTGDDGDGTNIEGVELWYRASLRDQGVKNPDLLRRLVLVRGLDAPVVDADSPYQEIDPKTGRLSPQSMRGYPIHILVTRSMGDAPYVMSDCSISRPQVNELNRFREMQTAMRDSNIPIRIAHPDIPDEVMEKMRRAEYRSAPVKIPDDVWNATAGDPIKEIAKATYPRENFAFEEKQDADIARTHAMDSNQAGIRNDSARTATELQLVQQNANVRLEKERAKVLDWYIRGVTKFSTLIQRFVTEQQAAEIVGAKAAQSWAQIMSQVPASLAFFAAPDSALRVDAAQRRRLAMEKYGYLRNDPAIDPTSLLKNDVLPSLGLDERVIKQPSPPPPPQPDPPKVSVSIKGEDLMPTAPQYPGVLVMLKSSGMDVSALPQPQVGQNTGIVQPDMGMEGQSEDPTSRMQGTQFAAPMAPGGAGMDALED